MNKRNIMAIVAVIIAIFALYKFRQAYPEITWPVVNSYNQPPEAPSEKGSPYKLYYEQLGNVEKQAYNMIMEEIYDMPDKILVPDLDEDMLDNVFRAVLYDNPDLFFLGRKCTVTAELWNDFFSVEYIITKEEYEKQKAELDAACDKVLATLSGIDTEEQKERKIHNYIVDNCEYKIVESEYVYSSAYGCLVNGVAACEGYSKAAKLLMDKAGIESTVISGKAAASQESGGAHMWNIVKINGDYYHLDCTWDDPVTNKGGSIRLYTYFNVNDSFISRTHSDFSINIDCNSTSENYYSKNNLNFQNYSKKDESRLTQIITSQYKKGERQIQLCFVDEKSYNEAFSQLIDDGRLYNVLTNGNNVVKDLYKKLKGYIPNPNAYTITLSFE